MEVKKLLGILGATLCVECGSSVPGYVQRAPNKRDVVLLLATDHAVRVLVNSQKMEKSTSQTINEQTGWADKVDTYDISYFLFRISQDGNSTVRNRIKIEASKAAPNINLVMPEPFFGQSGPREVYDPGYHGLPPWSDEQKKFFFGSNTTIFMRIAYSFRRPHNTGQTLILLQAFLGVIDEKKNIDDQMRCSGDGVSFPTEKVTPDFVEKYFVSNAPIVVESCLRRLTEILAE